MLNLHRDDEKWIVDTDPGCDDMMALLYLLKRKNVNLLMISLVAGNVSLDHVSTNTMKIMKLAGKSIPLNRGAGIPIIRTFYDIESYHYCDGLGDIEEIIKYEAHDVAIEQESSVIKLLQYAEMYPNQINLLCLGPLTNLAAAFMLDKEICKKFKSIYMMGGSTHSQGNLLPASEFNFAYDFIAAKIIIKEFRNIILTPWEPTMDIYVRDNTIMKLSENIRLKKQKLNQLIFYFVSLIISKFTADKNGTQLCDLYSVITAFQNKSVIKFSICECDIVIDSPLLFGMLYVKSKREVKDSFSNFLTSKLFKYNLKGHHIIIEELDETTIFEEYEHVLTE